MDTSINKQQEQYEETKSRCLHNKKKKRMIINNGPSVSPYQFPVASWNWGCSGTRAGGVGKFRARVSSTRLGATTTTRPKPPNKSDWITHWSTMQAPVTNTFVRILTTTTSTTTTTTTTTTETSRH